MIGDKVAVFESGNRGTSTISSGKDDPGGISYGKYQLSSKTGTLQSFLEYSGYDVEFEGLEINSKEFKDKWLELADDEDFQDAEHGYIHKIHYIPVRLLATNLGLGLHPAINEALWSMSIQHGKAKTIVTNAVSKINENCTNDTKAVIDVLYDARIEYVKKLKLPENTLNSLLTRYRSERSVIHGMIS